ncbi:MAG: protein phosphatase CheZ [Rhodospirillaceae bacterium]|nr:protein phosphatase CheZ [Rhodospirillaceae bacterium]
MEKIRSVNDLTRHIDEASKVENTPPRLADLGRTVGALTTAWPNNRGIYDQLKRLHDFIERTKSEIAAIRPDDVKREHLPKATDELDAIVEATAGATNRIMDAAEVFTDLSGRMTPEDADKAMNAVTSIYEACSFQDITGQRITKVVKTLKVIEARLEQMVASADLDGGVAATRLTSTKPEGDAALLNGPALPGQGHNQDDIDALLASFDN